MKRLFLIILAVLLWSSIESFAVSDTLKLEGSRGDFYTFMVWISSISGVRHVNQGNNMNNRFGHTTGTESDSNYVIIGIDQDTVIAFGLDSSEIDSVKCVIRNTLSTQLDAQLFGEDDTVWVALYKIVPSDTDIVETDPRFDSVKVDEPWDTIGLGQGNDIVAENQKSEALGGGGFNDTMFYFVGTVELGNEDNMVNQTGTVFEGLQVDEDDWEFFLPLQDFKEGVENDNFVKWAMKTYRLNDYLSNDVCGLQFRGDDAVGSLQMDVYIFYTQPDEGTGRRKKVVQDG